MSKFRQSVIRVVKHIPRGKVVSYGQVALYVGIPRAARQVGWTLNKLSDEFEFPWWRVVNNEGRISIKGSRHNALEQKRLLVEEGLEIDDDLSFDIEKYRFIPDKKTLDQFPVDPAYLEFISQNIKFMKYFGG